MTDHRDRWLDAVAAWQCYQTELSEPARVMLMHMGRFMDPGLTVRRSQRKLADEMGKERRTIRAYVAEAVSVGFLVPEERAVKDRRTAAYRGSFPPAAARPLAPQVPLSARRVGGTGRPPGIAGVGGTSGPPHGRDGAPTPKSDSGRDGMTPLVRRPTGDATSLTSTTSTPDEPPSPEDEETFPEDRGCSRPVAPPAGVATRPRREDASPLDQSDGTPTGGTPDGYPADSHAGLLDQGDHSGPGSRVTGPTARASAPVAADPTTPPTEGARGHLAAVPPLDRSGQATDEHAQLNRDDERHAS